MWVGEEHLKGFCFVLFLTAFAVSGWKSGIGVVLSVGDSGTRALEVN